MHRTRERAVFLSTALAIALFASARATAGDYRTRDVGDWTVTASRDGTGCFLTRQYDGVGETALLLGIDVNGANHLSVLNDNWSIEPREQLKLDFRLSSGSYAKHVAIGMASNGKKGFVTTFEAKFPTYFAASRSLYISRGDVPVEQLSLAGSGAAVAELQRCVDSYRDDTGSGTTGSKRSGAIPKDPFASDTTRPSKKQRSSQ